MKAKIKNLISTNNYQRAKGKLKISFMSSNDETSIHDLYQSGALKVLIPKSKSKYAEAVLINTGEVLLEVITYQLKLVRFLSL